MVWWGTKHGCIPWRSVAIRRGFEHLNRCLRIVSDTQQAKLLNCDNIIRQYKEFATENSANPGFRSFTDSESRLDMLLYNSIANGTDWTDLWEFIRKPLLLSRLREWSKTPSWMLEESPKYPRLRVPSRCKACKTEAPNLPRWKRKIEGGAQERREKESCPWWTG